MSPATCNLWWLSWLPASLWSGSYLTSCPDKQQLSSSAVAANVSLTSCLELQQAALLRDTLTALKQFKKDPEAQKKNAWYAEKMGNGLGHYHKQPLILCCAAVCSRTLHPAGIHWGMCLSHPSTQLYALNWIHYPEANGGCSLRSIPCAASAAPVCVQAAITCEPNTRATRHICRSAGCFCNSGLGRGFCAFSHMCRSPL